MYANGVENDDEDDVDDDDDVVDDEGHALQLHGIRKAGLCALVCAWTPEKGGKPSGDGYGNDGIAGGRGGGGGGGGEKSAILDPKSKKEYGLAQSDGANRILALSEVRNKESAEGFSVSASACMPYGRASANFSFLARVFGFRLGRYL